MDKIGRGNFGDVYRANLHVKGRGSKNVLEQSSYTHAKGRGKNIQSVAAKTCKVSSKVFGFLLYLCITLKRVLVYYIP